MPMKPMFLPGIEVNLKPSAYKDSVEMMKSGGQEYPQIWNLFAFLPSATHHLAQFTQQIMREPGPLTPGFRELIAAYTSSQNQCPF